MGMFDYVRVEGYELPGLDPRLVAERQDRNESLAEGPAVFQTKDMENCLSTYVIKEGRLFERIHETEEIPEEESGRYDRSEGEGTFFGRWRPRRVVSYEDVDLDYHGDIRFYAAKKELELAEEWESGLLEFKARFTHGDLEWIRPAAEENN
jgi:hypothetical protein